MARKKSKSDEKKKSIPVNVSYHSKLKVLAYLKGLTLTELTEKIFDDYIKKQEKNNGLNGLMAQIEQVEKKTVKTKADKNTNTELAATIIEDETVEQIKIDSEQKEEIKKDTKKESNEQEVSQTKIETEKEVEEHQETIKEDVKATLNQDSQVPINNSNIDNTIYTPKEEDVFSVGPIYIDTDN